MRVGIMTFHNVINYGGVLQCYALQQTLVEEGYDVEIINYENSYFKKFYSPLYISSPFFRKTLYMIYAFPQKCKRKIKFADFRKKYLQESSLYTAQNINTVNGKYDAIVVGSDQVWNLVLTNNDENYFIPFVNKGKKIAYAASIGLKEIPQELKNKYETLIKGFGRISVREESAANIINDLTGEKPQVCIDPVLLLGEKGWNSIANDSQLLAKEKYILVYKINKSICYKAAKRLQEETGLKVVVIKPDKTCDRTFCKFKCISPVEFVSLFSRAQYIVTDSFHGTVFSILFGKKFAYYRDQSKDNRNVRILNLLDSLGLNSRCNDTVEDVLRVIEEIDYSNVSAKLEIQREISKKYLLNSINEE